MILLPNDCQCSELSVCPKDWATSKNTNKDWYIHFRFFDPEYADRYPDGKPVIVKKGLNYFKDPAARRELVKTVKEATLEKLQVKGFNPITGKCCPPKPSPDTLIAKMENEFGIAHDVSLDIALIKSWERLALVKYEPEGKRPDWNSWREQAKTKQMPLELSTVRDMLSALRSFLAAATGLGIQSLPAKDVSRKYIVLTLKECNKTPNRTNKIKNYMSILFNDIQEMQVVEDNPTEKIKPHKITRGKRKMLSADVRGKIVEKLARANPRFLIFTQIFFHSGARETELFRVKGKDVDIERQTVKVLVKKDRMYKEELKVIKDIALPFWISAARGCRLDDYVFSFGLKPGAEKADPDIINKIWKKLIKDDPNIDDQDSHFYDLKAIHTTEVSHLLSQEEAAEHNSHTSVRMVQKVYDIDHEERSRNRVRTLNNALA